MNHFKSNFLNIMQERGFIHQISASDALDNAFCNGTVSAYVGYDATASSLHAGSLVSIMMLRWLQQCGHRPLVLMGGGTSLVGDPSGKDDVRVLLTPADIERNIQALKGVFAKFLTFGETKAQLVNNAAWLCSLNYIDMLRDVGRHFSVNRMLTFDSVKLRLEREQPLSFLEFNYMVLQAYDFVELYRRTGCTLQMGGSDQWGNIVNGIELGRRVENASLYALTCPLLTTASGAKMGKTAAGAVWLNADLLSPYDYWQYWRNVDDADVGRFLRLFTMLPLEEIARLDQLQGAERNEAKKILANEATRLLHGSAAADQAAQTAQATFEAGAMDENLPTLTLARADVERGLGVLDAFVRSGLLPSTSEARRQIKGGGLRVNDVVVDDPQMKLTPAHFQEGVAVKLSFGRKKHVRLVAEL